NSTFQPERSVQAPPRSECELAFTRLNSRHFPHCTPVGMAGAPTSRRHPFRPEPQHASPHDGSPLSTAVPASRLPEPAARRRGLLPRVLQGGDVRPRGRHLPTGVACRQGLPVALRAGPAVAAGEGKEPLGTLHPETGRSL